MEGGGTEARGRRGVTLAELAMVVAMVGIVAAVAFPRLREWVVLQRTRGAANVLAGDLAYARALAVRTGAPARLVVESGGGCAPPPTGTAGHRYRVVARDGVERLVDIRAGGGRVCLTSTRPDAVVFDSRGVLVGHNNRTLRLHEGNRSGATLTLSAVGRVLRRYGP